jgi:hypothetical protein
MFNLQNLSLTMHMSQHAEKLTKMFVETGQATPDRVFSTFAFGINFRTDATVSLQTRSER